MRKRVLLAALPLAVGLLVPFSTNASAQEVPPDCAVPPFIDLTQYNVVIGTNASETLRGTADQDFICGRLGNDVIIALGGDDLILGDTTTFFGDVTAEGGNDQVYAGAGNDEVLSGPGSDFVLGDGGNDSLMLAVGNDTGFGGTGADTIIGGFGRDNISGGDGNDELAGGFNNDVINGNAGNDLLVGEQPPFTPPPPNPAPPATNDQCIGGTGTDVAFRCDIVVGVP
jgi:Ca2+-binding RTX toxin-like protein